MQLITGTTQLLGIIGDPVEHSLSPVMHNAAIEYLDLDYVYVPFHVTPRDLKRAIAGFSAIDLVGFSITIPHKQKIMPLLKEISDDAANIGAVNTVVRRRTASGWKGWKGTNTDVEGFVAPLQAIPRDWTHVTPIVLGNGGAARAVIAGLFNLGCQEIHVVGRNPDKLKKFKKSWKRAPAIKSSLKTHNWENLSSLLSDADLLVNTTPVGMSPQGDASPIDEALMQKLKPQAIVYDLIYTPNPTKFLKLAKAREATTIDGLEMLVQQGVAALKFWLEESVPGFEQPVPVEVMQDSLNKYLLKIRDEETRRLED